MKSISTRITRHALAFTAALAFAVAPAWADTVTWDGSLSDLWTDAANWDSDPNLPAADDDVVFGNTGAGLVDLNGPQTSRTATFNNTTGNDYTIGDAGDLWTFGTNANPGIGITLSGTGDVTINADVSLGSTTQLRGIAVTEASARLILAGTTTIGRLNINSGAGVVEIASGAEMNDGNSSSVFVRLSGGHIHVNGTLDIPILQQVGGSAGSAITVGDGAVFAVDDLRVGTNASEGGLNFTTDRTTAFTYASRMLFADANNRQINFVGNQDFISTGVWDVTNTADPNVVIANGRTVTTTNDFVQTGSGILDLSGGGTLVLDGTSYGWTGAINVGGATDTAAYTGATLIVNSAMAAGDTVTVGTSSVLGGSGTINRAVDVLTGGTLAPGESIGELTIDDLTLAAGFILDWEYDEGLDERDLVTIDGTLDLTAATSGTINLINLGTGTLKDGEILFSATNITGAPGDGVLAWTISDNEDYFAKVDGNNVILVIPEPATLVLALAGGLLILPARWGRRVSVA